MVGTKFLRKWLIFMSLGKPQNSGIFFCSLLLYLLLIIGICEAIRKVHDVDKAIMSISMLNATSVIFLSYIVHIVNPKPVLELIKLIEEDFLLNVNDFIGREGDYWENIRKIYRKTEKNMEFTNKCIKVTFVVLFWGFVFKNIVPYLLDISVYSENKSEPWITPFLWHIPAEFEPIGFFVYLYSFHTIVLILLHMEGYLVLILVCLSIERLMGDFETFYKLIDNFCQDYIGIDLEKIDNNSMRMVYLKADMIRLVRCHQRIVRSSNSLADNGSFMISALIIAVINDSITNAYFMLKSNEVKKAVTFAMMFFLINVLLSLVYQNGQRIFNQNEMVRRRLAEIPWTDKPHWLKQMVHIMMMQSNVNLELKPYGIFILNNGSFKDIVHTRADDLFIDVKDFEDFSTQSYNVDRVVMLLSCAGVGVCDDIKTAIMKIRQEFPLNLRYYEYPITIQPDEVKGWVKKTGWNITNIPFVDFISHGAEVTYYNVVDKVDENQLRKAYKDVEAVN